MRFGTQIIQDETDLHGYFTLNAIDFQLHSYLWLSVQSVRSVFFPISTHPLLATIVGPKPQTHFPRPGTLCRDKLCVLSQKN